MNSVERRRFRWLFAGVAVAGVTADVLSKILAVRWLDPRQPVELLNGL